MILVDSGDKLRISPISLFLLMKDAQEIDQLISYLINKENSEGVVLLGHSTGCQVIDWLSPQTLTFGHGSERKIMTHFSLKQDIVYYMGTNAACSRAVRAAILQVPILDSVACIFLFQIKLLVIICERA